MTAPKPKKESRRRSRAKRELNLGGRPATHDWTQWRRLYMRGDDRVSLESLSIITGAPSLAQLKRRSSAEDWPSLRAELRAQSDTKIRELDANLKTEFRLQQLSLGKAMITLGVRGMAHDDPAKLEPIDKLRYIKTGSDLARKALGMEEINVRLGRIKNADDLDSLSEAELFQIAGVLPEEEDDESF